MKKYLFIFSALFLAIPVLAFAGSQSYTFSFLHCGGWCDTFQDGYTFTVPAYGTLTVHVQGGSGLPSLWTCNAYDSSTGIITCDWAGGSMGYDSSFGDITASGNYPANNNTNTCSFVNDANSPTSYCGYSPGTDGTVVPREEVDVTFPAGELPVGSSIPVKVGAPDGSVAVTWTEPPPPTQHCPDGSSAPNGDSNQCTCAQGNTSQCLPPPSCPNGLDITQYPTCTCPSGQVQQGDTCITPPPTVCPNGLNITQYPTCSCPAGQVQQGTTCVTPPPPPPPLPTCSVTFDQNPIQSGAGTTMYWNSTNADHFYINSVGYVGASGATGIGPGASTDYSGSVSNSSGSAICPAILYVTTAPTCQSGLDIIQYPSCECPAGKVQSGNTCITPRTSCPNGLDKNQYPSCTCPAGQIQSGNRCITPSTSCQSGLNINQYPSCTCPSGQVQQGSICVASSCANGLNITQYPSCRCPAGKVQSGSQCITPCTEAYSCQGDNLYYRNINCTNSFIEACSWGCATNACYPAPSATLTAIPLIVRQGTATSVHWSAQNVTSCTVTGTNADSWSGLSGTETSGHITAQTTFSLRCLTLNHSNFTKNVIVNIIPVFCEPGSPGC